MKQSIPTCAVNLETLERKYFPSFIAAAVHTGVSKEQISKCFHQDTPFNDITKINFLIIKIL